MMLDDIFDVPASRSRNVIGTSTIVAPMSRAAIVISAWNTNPEACTPPRPIA